MKIVSIFFMCLFLVSLANAQERFLTKKGMISFFSETPIENIKAENNQVLSIVDLSKGQMAIAILMKSFMFEKALMQEHFNENYVESDKYPKATFKGNLLDFDEITKSEVTIVIKGNLTIHGITKEMTIEALTKKTAEHIEMAGDFFIDLADFDVKIPSIVKNNISEKIKVSFRFQHKPYNK
ncbi:MAG: polyisoprenoid-binding protein YceI [Arenicella sp.]|jgi:polyisoprenoid-binding protein YceI